jgi:hypothetical protein
MVERVSRAEQAVKRCDAFTIFSWRIRAMFWRTTGMQVLVVIGLLVGCGTTGLGVYDKPGAPEADVKRDRSACLRASASDSDPFRFSGPTIDREAFARCMEAKGYTLGK